MCTLDRGRVYVSFGATMRPSNKIKYTGKDLQFLFYDDIYEATRFFPTLKKKCPRVMITRIIPE
jgi:hypothetical protein